MLKKLYTCDAGIELLNRDCQFNAFPLTEDDDVNVLEQEFYSIMVDESDLIERYDADYPSYDVVRGASVDVIKIPTNEKYR